jgi:hypothetical protein
MDKLLESYYSLCSPAKLYLLLSIVNLSIFSIASYRNKYSLGVNGKNILIMLLTCGMWTYILNLICSSGWEVISWVLVILPIITSVIAMCTILFLSK